MIRLSPPVSQENRLAPQQDLGYVVLEDTQEKSLSAYIYTLRRRKFLFIVPSLVFLPILLLNLATQDPTYQATSTIRIEKVNPNVIPIVEVISPERTANSPDFYLTQYEIIKSPMILGKVIDTLHLYEEKPFQKTPPRFPIINEVKHLIRTAIDGVISVIQNFLNSILFTEEDMENLSEIPQPEEQHRKDAIARLQGSIEVKSRKGTELLDITVRGSNHEEVVQIADAVAEAYIQQNLDNKLNASRQAIVWLSREAKSLREKIDSAELVLKEFKEKSNYIHQDEFRDLKVPLVHKLNVLYSSYTEINNARSDLKIKIDELKRLLNKNLDILAVVMRTSPDIGNFTPLKSLVERYSELLNQHYSSSERFGENHPRLLQNKLEIDKIKESIYSEIKNLVNAMQEEHKILTERESSLLKSIQEQEKKLIDMSNNVREYSKIKNEIEIDKDLYIAVSKRLAETTLTEALESNNVKLVQPASFSNNPLPSMNKKKILLGAMFTLALGAGLAFLRDSLDKQFKSVNEVERYLGVPFLGTIPSHNGGSKKPIALYNPGVNASEAYRTLRTWIRLSSQNSIKTLLITSANLGEGKSLTAANLAVSFAQLGQKILLVDADLRRPMLHHIFNITNHRGLVDILEDGAEWESVLQDTVMENLKLLPTGGRPHNPAELLSTKRMQSMLGSLKGAFDILIVDAPVTLSIPDVTILTPAMDAILLVHYPLKVNREAVLDAKKTLERAGANLLGIIFNNITPKMQKSYCYSQQHYHYHYAERRTTRQSRANVTLIDMRPTESREQWAIVSPTSHNPSNHDS